jgi:uncharacterized protein (DUF4415 family)
MKKKIKKLPSKLKQSIKTEFEKDFDFSKAQKKGIFINLNQSTIDYFKNLSTHEGKGYQILIQEALQFFVEKKLKPKVSWE